LFLHSANQSTKYSHSEAGVRRCRRSPESRNVLAACGESDRTSQRLDCSVGALLITMRAMALGKQERERQETLWIATAQVAKPPSHPFYKRLDAILADHRFDDFVEKICAKFYAPRMRRPGLAPGVYFRLLLIGYFEGLDSERGIAWRTADSLGLRDFLGLTLTDAPPDHSTLSRHRRFDSCCCPRMRAHGRSRRCGQPRHHRYTAFAGVF